MFYLKHIMPKQCKYLVLISLWLFLPLYASAQQRPAYFDAFVKSYDKMYEAYGVLKSALDWCSSEIEKGTDDVPEDIFKEKLAKPAHQAFEDIGEGIDILKAVIPAPSSNRKKFWNDIDKRVIAKYNRAKYCLDHYEQMYHSEYMMMLTRYPSYFSLYATILYNSFQSLETGMREVYDVYHIEHDPKYTGKSYNV